MDDKIEDGWYLTKFCTGDTLVLQIVNGIDESGFDMALLQKEGVVLSIERVAILSHKEYLRINSLIDFQVEKC